MKRIFSPSRSLFRVGLLGLMLSGCAVGPDYLRPDLDMPEHYKEIQADLWQPARALEQADSLTEKQGPWWSVFQDAELDELVNQVVVNNQNVRAAVASFHQAQASLQAAQSTRWPDLTANLSRSRAQNRSAASGSNANASPGSGLTGVTTGGQGVLAGPRNNVQLNLLASWEPDFWGRLERGIEAQTALRDASQADLAAAQLSAQALLVKTYFQLSATDLELALMKRSLAAYQQALEITRHRQEAGVAARSDVVQAEVQLQTAKAQRLELTVQRGQLEHAIAVLIGRTPARFTLAVRTHLPQQPDIPLSLPAQLLERRADIIAAERRLIAANARIGVAQAAYFPALTLGASLGYQHDRWAGLLATPQRVWSFGPSLALQLLDGGARQAATATARAEQEGSTASYRQTVLTAMQEVEDNLLAVQVFDQAAQVQTEATQAARELLELSENQYQAGTVGYLQVVAAQNTALVAERNLIDFKQRQLQAAASLIQALGGGWSNSVENAPAWQTDQMVGP